MIDPCLFVKKKGKKGSKVHRKFGCAEAKKHSFGEKQQSQNGNSTKNLYWRNAKTNSEPENANAAEEEK